MLLCRHGETAYNRGSAASTEERIRGWKDVPLDDNGRKQAHEMAEAIASEAPDVERIYSSPLERAHETAQCLGKVLKLPVKTDEALKPWHVGQWAGKRVQDVLPRMEKLITTPKVSAPGGEPFQAFVDRYLAFLRKVLVEAERDAATICLVAHTRNLQLTRGWLAAGALADNSYDPEVVNNYDHETGTGKWMTLQPLENRKAS